MATIERQAFRYGQHIRIIDCPQNHPDHVGQLGTVAQKNKTTTTIRVHVGIGICQAAAVELVAEDPVVVTPMPIQWPMIAPLPGTSRVSNRPVDA